MSFTAVEISSREVYGMHKFRTVLGKDKLCGDTTMFTGTRDLPIVILGQFFGFGQSRLYPRWEKVGFTDGVQSYPLLSEQTSTGCESSVRFHHHGKGQRIHAPMIAKVQEPGFG